MFNAKEEHIMYDLYYYEKKKEIIKLLVLNVFIDSAESLSRDRGFIIYVRTFHDAECNDVN